jgi:formylglycine-generating enzyme required for sulfatase activity
MNDKEGQITGRYIKNAEARYEEARRRAQLGRALQWGETQKEEIKELRSDIITLTKQRTDDNKGCGAVIQKIMTMVDTNCSAQIGAIQGECTTTSETLVKVMRWMDDKFKGDTETLREQIDKQINQIPGNNQTTEEAQILISNIETLRRKM